MAPKRQSSVDDIKRRLAYYKNVRDYARGVVDRTEENMQGIQHDTDDFSKDFDAIRKKNKSLLDKADRRVEREEKRLENADRT